MRARFDEHKDERDLVKAQKILEDAEKEFEEVKHPQQIICTLCFMYALFQEFFLLNELVLSHTVVERLM